MKNLRVLLGALFFVFIIGVVATLSLRVHTPERAPGPLIVTSAYPLGYFAGEIAGTHATVRTITPLGAEPHDYEPTVEELGSLESAQLFLYVGGGFDPWAEKAAQNINRKVPSASIISPDGSALLSVASLITDSSRAKDPHAWLDPLMAKEIIKNVTEALTTVDPANAQTYTVNGAALASRLDALHGDFASYLASCTLHDIVVSHNAYAYLGARYHFNVIPIAGLSPEQEPSPKTMGEIAKLAQEKGIHYIFSETILSPRISETIAKEIDAKTLVLNPVENLTEAEKISGANYFTLMRGNLSNLTKALSCKKTL